MSIEPLALKILIVAEHASAAFGGEALVPYQYFRQLRKLGADVHLLVHQRTKQELLQAFPEDVDRLHFVADSLLNIVCHKIGLYFPDRIAAFSFGALSHLETQLRQRNHVRSLQLKYKFDVIHEPIPVSPKLPSALFGMSSPVIIGPMNGGMDYPPNYKTEGRMERWFIAGLRGLALMANFFLPGKRRAALLLVANERTRQALPKNLRAQNIVQFVENGVDTSLFFPNPLPIAPSKIFRMIHIGRLVDVKRVDLLLEACGKLKGKTAFHLDLVGDGPLRGDLERKAEHLLISNNVTFHGRLPQSAAAEFLRDSQVMVFPSMRECGGAVVLEAMACGVPVIATDWGGPADYITPATGIVVPPATPVHFVDALAEAMLWMAQHPEARIAMGRAGRQRAEQLYDWGRKATALLRIYSDVVKQTKSGRVCMTNS